MQSVSSIRPYFPSSQSLRAIARTEQAPPLRIEDLLSIAGALMVSFLEQSNDVTAAIAQLSVRQRVKIDSIAQAAKQAGREDLLYAGMNEISVKNVDDIKHFFDEALWELGSHAAKADPAQTTSRKIAHLALSFLENEHLRSNENKKAVAGAFYARDPFTILDVTNEVLDYISRGIHKHTENFTKTRKYCDDNKVLLEQASCMKYATPVQLEKACIQLSALPKILEPLFESEKSRSPVFFNMYDNSNVLFALSSYTMSFVPDNAATHSCEQAISNVILPDKFHDRSEHRTKALVTLTPSL